MRLVGNKTHGDLAEIGIMKFINQFMYDYKSLHVGKELFRSKTKEEDIVITNEITKTELCLSLKAYGHGPLQLSTDKNCTLFPFLQSFGQTEITDQNSLDKILSNEVFLTDNSIMPLIYDEKAKKCNITIFDYILAKSKVTKIEKRIEGKGRLHPVYVFLDNEDKYIFEVRYGGKKANALQRGLWANTKRAETYFNSLTNGWINYSHNLDLVRLIAMALNSRKQTHKQVNIILENC
jgi:hypothetical protein